MLFTCFEILKSEKKLNKSNSLKAYKSNLNFEAIKSHYLLTYMKLEIVRF